MKYFVKQHDPKSLPLQTQLKSGSPARGLPLFTAAREGFEPPEAFTPQTLSRRPHSAALPPRQNR